MRYQWMDEYLMAMKGVSKDFKEEWSWTRYFVGEKMFAAVCKNSQGEDYLITLKLEPLEGDFLRQQYEDIIPGYYMNKTHWNSVKAEGNVPDQLLQDMLEKSYHLILSKLPKSKQKEIIEE
ncbi:MmcQ/YjbR family DNA-binding protein [Clostridium sp. E02]|uniref:MmcQ/YjbR family DNA-binding protein n=1 Tax=Clostridium sp. E02 TaxID=2487134 RepID=UPI000F530F2B|nr:MmcQ/YjbR family DNA-binding protein [Clostridium sp. E02]